MSLRPFQRLAALVLLGALAPGCSFFEPSISVEHVRPGEVYATLNLNVLNSGELSTATREVLHAHSLEELYDDDPAAALRALHEAAVHDPLRGNLFALAEVAYLEAIHHDDRNEFLASAIYAWFYLFSTDDPDPPSPFDRRFRWACDIYNTALLRACPTTDEGYVTLGEKDRTLPVGSIHITIDSSAFPWSAQDYPSFAPGDDYLIHGLSLRLRDSGLGVPLVGVPSSTALQKTPASALLRVSGSLADMAGGLKGTLELYSVFDARSVHVGATTVPLESDISVTLAYALHESPIWKFSLSGLFSGERAIRENQLRMVRPYQRGRIPVVFVHGTASNPAYWAEMFNTLLGDPEIRERMQIWLFQYATGNPIIYTASTLRDQLQETLARVDPDGTDPAMKKVILIGHSQGGLIVKMMVVDGSLNWFEQAVGKKFEDFGFDADQTKLLDHVYNFKAESCVDRAVFISTPHRGSYRADSWIVRMIAKLIALPGEVQNLGSRLTSGSAALPPELAGRLPTSLDNMNPSSPILASLNATPIAPWVTCNSIIPIGDADPHDPESLADADDGVVKYRSAHIEGVESELLVHAHHSCQDNPLVIQEVRRILHEVLAQP